MLEYSQFKQMLKNTEGMQKSFNRWLHDFLLTEALRALRLVRPITPVDTGNLRRQWSISKVERTGNSLRVFLTNPVEYASFMEEGFSYRTKTGTGWFEGFHMAEISLLQVRSAMPKRFSQAFEKWASGYGWG